MAMRSLAALAAAGLADGPGLPVEKPLYHANASADGSRTSLFLQVFCNKTEADRTGKISVK